MNIRHVERLHQRRVVRVFSRPMGCVVGAGYLVDCLTADGAPWRTEAYVSADQMDPDDLDACEAWVKWLRSMCADRDERWIWPVYIKPPEGEPGIPATSEKQATIPDKGE